MIFNKPLIALDIGSSSVKLAELSGKGASRKLRTLGLEVIPQGAVMNGEIQDASALLKVVKKLLTSMNIEPKGRRVGLSLSGGAVILKRMVLMPDDESDLSEQVFEEAKQQFHHDMSDMYFRYQELPSKFTQEGEKAFLIVAGRIDIIEQYVDVIHKAGMKVGVIDTDTFCLANSFEFNYPIAESLVAIANVGANSTQVVLTYEGEYLYSREFYLGGNLITKKISEDLAIDFENAEGLKISASGGDQAIADKIRASVRDINDQINSEINQTVEFFVQHENIPNLSEVKYIFLSGGAAMSLDLAPSLSSLLQAPVQIINPFNRIDTAPSGVDMEYLLSHGAIYGIATGLGLRKPDDGQGNKP
ncbi:type IV pilus assembly protein PilM [Pseudobacteriovorax antillogorgiicola]|uniref:Type IV pilus assembly protein PilM n=1 Tax=Pseudobacteriovorax antillogorgiicola TaxID=1513793 RepID=A0A1Y6B5E9_9BACT|nr:type IV pilus assembly protein PilM [Pseudobacteriovorax antillogorgiicola]TCS58917.1 type IV pilus assembly protein PilM [Pseudobacteriovorax antillogorgiicola]SME93223.1 type IV pilus assembly protein PilM [Pseudobacteriovorax antillogorgiicola]